jgi:hypothetical protein
MQHSFLIVSISAGIVQALAQIAASPAQAPTFLAENLPSASTFFMTCVRFASLLTDHDVIFDLGT